jgi:hypothetical protein
MKKVRLDLEALSVESFATADGGAERGTVRGFASDLAASCYDTCVAIGAPCGSENQTYVESCVAGACPDSYWQQCGEPSATNPTYKPLTGGGTETI